MCSQADFGITNAGKGGVWSAARHLNATAWPALVQRVHTAKV